MNNIIFLKIFDERRYPLTYSEGTILNKIFHEAHDI